MKNGTDSTAVGRAPDTEAFSNRKLIRPSLSREPGRSAAGVENTAIERRERAERNGAAGGIKKTPPPEQTHAENFYWVKQMQSHTPMAVVLESGEVLKGTVEWYDRDCIKLTRLGSPNLLVYKHVIKYLYKEGEDDAQGGSSAG